MARETSLSCFLLGCDVPQPVCSFALDPTAGFRHCTIPPPPPPPPALAWLLDLSTGGRVTILLRPDVAPKMVERVKTLTRQRFYDGLAFHRVIAILGFPRNPTGCSIIIIHPFLPHQVT